MGDGEQRAMEAVDEPVTASSIATDLRELGVDGGETLLVHASLSALGWVCGGAPAVVDGLMDGVTPAGTLVMPTHSTQYSDPARWADPPVPEGWIETIRAAMPPYRPAVTPTRGMGAIPECFRSYPEVQRSRHPSLSFAAWGANADRIVADHAFEYPLGEGSPLARVYDRGGAVLLLGVDHDRNTSLHLAEYRAAIDHATVTETAPVLVDGERVQIEYADIEPSSADFVTLGNAFERHIGAVSGTVGAAEARLIDHRRLVDFAVDWIETHR